MIQISEPKPEEPIPAECSSAAELGPSLLALTHTHSDFTSDTYSRTPPGPPIVTSFEVETRLEVKKHDPNASRLENSATAQKQSLDPAHSQNLQMARTYEALNQLLDLLHHRLTTDPEHRKALEEIHLSLQQSEQRQMQTLESTLRHMDIQRQSQAAEHGLHAASLQAQAQLEVNRLLRVMWLGTGLAAVGAGFAFILLTN